MNLPNELHNKIMSNLNVEDKINYYKAFRVKVPYKLYYDRVINELNQELPAYRIFKLNYRLDNGYTGILFKYKNIWDRLEGLWSQTYFDVLNEIMDKIPVEDPSDFDIYYCEYCNKSSYNPWCDDCDEEINNK